MDHGLVVGTNNELVNNLMKYLKENFETTDGEVNQFLEIEIDQGLNVSIFIHQASYCKHVLQKFNIEFINPVKILADPQHLLDPNVSESALTETVPCREAVGSLLYLNHVTRLDINDTVNVVNRYLEKPYNIYWNAMKRILLHLKGTMNYDLFYDSSAKLELTGYSDTDYA